MNLLDCAAVAVPTGFYKNGVGFGVTLFHQAFHDKQLMSFATRIQQFTALNLGATKNTLVESLSPKPAQKHTIDVVVCGAHLQGCVLNWQLQERGATFIKKTTTTKNYRFYSLAGGPPLRPGLVRILSNGVSIDVEVWRMPSENFGSFVAEIPAPLGIGKVELADGSWESGFICDSFGLDGAEDISHLGSWREFLKSKSV